MIKEYEETAATEDFSQHLGETSDFEVLAKPKLRISRTVANAMVEQDVSMRQLAEKIGNMKHPQIHRITSGKNYNIDTLLRVLNGLGLELIIQKKGGESV